jgi:hypothetical protein
LRTTSALAHHPPIGYSTLMYVIVNKVIQKK